jgi:hypothetical protein
MEKEYDFKFSANEAQTLVDGLSELPLKKSIAVLQKLQGQFNSQNIGETEEKQEEVLTEEK